MKRSSLAGAALLFIPAIAAAEPYASTQAGSTRQFDITAPDINNLSFARQELPPNIPSGTTAIVAQSRTIYLNKDAVTLVPGDNDSRLNHSTIAAQQTALPAWAADATTWAATVACMRDMFAPFNATVVDTRPTATTNYIEAKFGGSPTQLGMPTNVAGVSPFTTDCGIIENSIVFTFTDAIPNIDAQTACEIMSQEVAHSFGLDHEMLASDPMTYLQYTGKRTFKDQAVSCGEYADRACGINGSTCRANQDSVALLKERLGVGGGQPGDNVAPVVGITSPSNNAVVPPGFDILFTATDNVAVTMATLYVDDSMAGSVIAAPFKFTTSPTLPEGSHVFRIDATDGTNTQSQSVTVTIRKGALPPGTGDQGDNSGDIAGGCSTGGGGSLALSLGVLGFATLRRRRR